MVIFEVKIRNKTLLDNLLEVWEGSVKATHTFLQMKK